MLFMEWNKTYHRRKICIIFFSVVLMSMVLCGRLVYLMLFEGKYYETQAKDLQQRERKIKAARGKILDRNGVVLADNKSVCTISVIHNQIKEPEAVIAMLVKELGISEEKVRKRVEKYSSLEKIKSNVDKETGNRILAYGYAGVKVDEDDAIVDVVLDTLQDMKYPFKNTDFIPDIMGYYYSIALISQSMHRREETIKLFNELVDYAISIKSNSALPLARNMDVLSKEYPDLSDLFEKAKTIYRFDAIDSIKERVPIQVNKLYHDYTNADKIEAEYINVENPEDGKVFVEVDENGYVVRIVEKGKNIYTKIFKHYSYDMINYAIVRDVLLRKHMEEMRINDIADARVVEATRTDLKKLYSDIEISVNNKEFAYILDGHEKFNNT